MPAMVVAVSCTVLLPGWPIVQAFVLDRSAVPVRIAAVVGRICCVLLAHANVSVDVIAALPLRLCMWSVCVVLPRSSCVVPLVLFVVRAKT